MRVTNSMMTYNVLRNINSNSSRLDKILQQTTSEKKVNVASDDPVAAARILKLRSYLSKVEQYEKNTDDALSWIGISESTLNNVNETIQRIRYLTVEASNSTVGDEDAEKIKSEILELRANLLDLANSSYSGRYIFAGYDTDKKPFATETTAVGEKILYRGQYLSLGGVVPASVSDSDYEAFVLANAANRVTGDKQEIEYRIGSSNQISINEEGFEVFGSNGEGLFDTITKLQLALEGETSYKTAEYSEGPPASVTIATHELKIDSVLSDLDKDLNRMLTSRAELGAKYNYLGLVQKRLSSNSTVFTELLSKNEDIDLDKAAIELMSAKTVYQASLASGAQVIQNSLLDFIR